MKQAILLAVLMVGCGGPSVGPSMQVGEYTEDASISEGTTDGDAGVPEDGNPADEWANDGGSSTPDTEDVSVPVEEHTIVVELTWETAPECANYMVLHLMNPKAEHWFDTPWDCYGNSCSQHWGSWDTDYDDDPWLQSEEGTQTITLNIPEEYTSGSGCADGIENLCGLKGTFTAGVYYSSDPNECGSATPTVRIWINGQIAFDQEGVEMVEDDLWEVATIDWPEGLVAEIPGEDGELKIIPNYCATQGCF